MRRIVINLILISLSAMFISWSDNATSMQSNMPTNREAAYRAFSLNEERRT